MTAHSRLHQARRVRRLIRFRIRAAGLHSMSSLPLNDSRNTAIHRDNLTREAALAQSWYTNYGNPEVQRSPSMDQLINLGTFSRYQSQVASQPLMSTSPMTDLVTLVRAPRSTLVNLC